MIKRILSNRVWTQSLRWNYHRVTSPQIVRRSQVYWESLRGRFVGKRGFVIGNGPSLRMSDLESIKSEISIASNKIYLAYSETNWRPTVHTCSDILVWRKFAKEMCAHSENLVITSNLMPSLGDKSRVILVRNLGPAIRSPRGFSTNMNIGCYSGNTITFNNIQIAAHMGLNPIYIIGCDHYYGGSQHEGQDNTKGVAHGSESYHFHKDYRQPGEIAMSAPIELMNRAYAIANAESAVRGISVLNATRGGYLEAFPRVDLDEVLSTGSPQSPE